jgi:hypothetical protein
MSHRRTRQKECESWGSGDKSDRLVGRAVGAWYGRKLRMSLVCHMVKVALEVGPNQGKQWGTSLTQ